MIRVEARRPLVRKGKSRLRRAGGGARPVVLSFWISRTGDAFLKCAVCAVFQNSAAIYYHHRLIREKILITKGQEREIISIKDNPLY